MPPFNEMEEVPGADPYEAIADYTDTIKFGKYTAFFVRCA
jgi:hypothetical protein